MKATLENGDLRQIPECDIVVPSYGKIIFFILPEITDARSSNFQDEPVIGRSFPIKTYSHGDNRTVTMKVHFVITRAADARRIIRELRALQSATYPQEAYNQPYAPPPVCKIRCGRLLAGQQKNGYLCAVLRQYSVQFPTDVAWYENVDGQGEYLPYKFSIDLTWEVVYANEELPGQETIMRDL